ncbi:hypothetical protein AAFF_G00062370 [Aldrovandia affinis]|uniref:Uncharacterized protein n=1 Tax=Aldrovandia affinis TaxID=143900 RepID=A0AAD7S256_9TELE|nr:hypothetical protein AAFF_G00062370 [Aldrovandia affinis]
MDPAEMSQQYSTEITQLHTALVNQGTTIGRHDQMLQDILINLQSLTEAFRQGQPSHSAQPPVTPAHPSSQAQPQPKTRHLDPYLPAPKSYNGHPGKCWEFLTQSPQKSRMRPGTRMSRAGTQERSSEPYPSQSMRYWTPPRTRREWRK